MKNTKQLITLISTTDLSYNEDGKALFHKLAKSVARKIAKDLNLPADSYDVRSNLGGIAVGGEVTLHAENVYIQLGTGVGTLSDSSFMYRHCNGRKDYTGGRNRWMRYEKLSDWETAIADFRMAMLKD